MTQSSRCEPDLWNGPLALKILWEPVNQGVALGWYGTGPLALDQIHHRTIESSMPQSLSFLLTHIVFSTKDRAPVLDAAVRPTLYAYLATVARNADCECFRAGGAADHVHIAIRLARTVTMAHLVEELKTSSSKWLKTQSPALPGFAWQRGYGAFSVGPTDQDSLIKYIDHQEKHHQARTFQEEYRTFLKKYGIEYDERYVWD
jgi:REP element-mobilizing transposase RayT